MKTGVVDVGGGMRGIYAAGVFDRCLDDGVSFDLGVGVSAGSANLASYFAGQRGRNFVFFTEYSFRKEYAGVGNFIRKRSYLDLDYIYGTLSNSDGENPLDFAKIAENPADFLVVATDALTGEARYFDKSEMRQDGYFPFMASCAIPFVCAPYEIDGVPYYDGALGDVVPIEKAFSEGCDRVVLILTKPRDYRRTPDRDAFLAKRIRKKYPKAAAKLARRAENYNSAVDRAKEYEREGRALIIAPDDTCGVDTLSRDRAAMERLYQKGYDDGGAVAAFVS